MNPKYRNLFLYILVFALGTFAGLKSGIFGAFLAGLYLSNGIAHAGYGFFGFGKITPKKLFGEERTIHSVWGVYNFVLFAILAYYSDLGANWPFFLVAVLITFVLLPIRAAKEKDKKE